MTAVQDYNAMLMGGGARSAKFEKEGEFVTGLVVNVDQRQRTDFRTGALLEWPDGNPRMQLLIMLDTELQEDEDDDGKRTVYVPIPSAIQAAIRDAVAKSGERGIGVGGKLRVTYTSTDEPKKRGENGAKRYSAQYRAPVVSLNDPKHDHEDADEPSDEPF